MRTEGFKGALLSALVIICLAALAILFLSASSVLIRGMEAPQILWEDNFDSYSELPTHKYEFKFGNFKLIDLGGGNKAVYQENDLTGEDYAMIPKGLIINYKNYELIFRGRIDSWSGIGVSIGNESTVWENRWSSGNEFVHFAPGNYSSSYPPNIKLWSRNYEPDYPPAPDPVTGDIPTENIFRWDNHVLRFTGDIGFYDNWRWVNSLQ